MRNNNLFRKVSTFINEINLKYPIELAYLFGSVARNEQGSLSDIDIAVKFKCNYSAMDDCFIRGELIDLGQAKLKMKVDIVSIDRASTFLKYQIIKDGLVLIDNPNRADFESLALREYFDFKYYSDIYNEAFINSLKQNKLECLSSLPQKDVVIVRLEKLKEYMQFLHSIKTIAKEKYISDAMIYGASERFLHLSIESVIDIANHLISDMELRKPESNRDIFEVLFENKILTKELKQNLSNMASFRNILVHDYLKLDRGLIYDIIQNNLKDLEEFINIVLGYV